MLNKYLVKGHSFRKAGSLKKAIQIYIKASKSQQQCSERDSAYYMQAFTYVLMAHRMHQQCQLGADLRSPEDPLLKANRCLRQIQTKNFDPEALGLPVLAGYEIDEIAKHASRDEENTTH